MMLQSTYPTLIQCFLQDCHSKRVKIKGTEDMSEYKDYISILSSRCLELYKPSNMFVHSITHYNNLTQHKKTANAHYSTLIYVLPYIAIMSDRSFYLPKTQEENMTEYLMFFQLFSSADCAHSLLWEHVNRFTPYPYIILICHKISSYMITFSQAVHL